MARGLVWGQATFRMLRTVSMLQRDRVWDSLTRRRDRGAPGSDGRSPRREAFDDGLLVVCLFVVVGLLVLGITLMLLVWTTASFAPRTLDSCAELDLCVAPAADRNESLGVDDPRSDELKMTR
jgi:hypothetical protein